MTKSKGIRDSQVTDTKTFIGRCEYLFGKGVLDYSKVDYTTTTTGVSLVCIEHNHLYTAIPNSVLTKKSTFCPKCAIENKRVKLKTDKSVIKNILEDKMLIGYKIHSLSYDNSNSLIKLECPIHGVFEKTVLGVKSAKYNVCPSCSRKVATGKRKQITWAKWESTLKDRHPEMDFSLFEYQGKNVKSVVICPVHGNFYSSVANLSCIKTACPNCYNEGRATDGETFKLKSKDVHGDFYGYDRAELQYSGSHTPVEIYCKHCKEYFKQKPNNHLIGKGCRKCAARNTAQTMHWNNPVSLSRKPDVMYKPTYLYVFALHSLDKSTSLYKVGITYEDNLRGRVRAIIREAGYSVETLHLFKSTRIDCLYHENKFHTSNKELSYVEKDRHYGGKYEVYKESQETLDSLKRLVSDVRKQNTFEEVSLYHALGDDFNSFVLDYEAKYVM